MSEPHSPNDSAYTRPYDRAYTRPHLKPNGVISNAVAKGGINGHARSKKATAVYKRWGT